jgi:hypothetical protein
MTGGRAHGIWAVGKEITYMSGYLPDLSPFPFLCSVLHNHHANRLDVEIR